MASDLCLSVSSFVRYVKTLKILPFVIQQSAFKFEGGYSRIQSSDEFASSFFNSSSTLISQSKNDDSYLMVLLGLEIIYSVLTLSCNFYRGVFYWFESCSSDVNVCLGGSITGIGQPRYFEDMLTLGVCIIKTCPMDMIVSPFEQLTLNPYF